MKIKVVGLVSDESKKTLINQFIKAIEERLTDFEVSENPEVYDLAMFLVTTGGVENQFKQIYKNFSEPYLIVYNEFNNSLPASLEILSFLNSLGLEGQLIDLNTLSPDLIKSIFPFFGERLGLIGRPSDWLIASSFPESLFEERFKLQVKYIPIEEAIEGFNSTNNIKAENLSKELMLKANAVYSINKDDLIKAFKFYLSLKDIVAKYKLNYVSVRCFDIIEPLDTTGCIALSTLNDEGIIAGCEGDLPSTISMALLHKASGKTPFMANISYIKESNGKLEIVLAHCTIGISATKGFNLRTHFETNKGVGIEGFFEHGPVTLLRIGGEKLNKAAVISGTEKGIDFSTQRCRTQINVEVDKNLKEYFMKKPLGNHHIAINGNHIDKLRAMLQNMSFEIVT